MERRAVPHPEGSTTRLINAPFGWYLHDAALAYQRLSFRLNKAYQLWSIKERFTTGNQHCLAKTSPRLPGETFIKMLHTRII